jgi:hypothetical protein
MDNASDKSRPKNHFTEKTARFNRKRLESDFEEHPTLGFNVGMALCQFVALNKMLSLEEFSAKYSHPFLVLLCGGAEKLVDSGFFTTSGGSSAAITDESLLESRVIFLVKTSKKSFKHLYSIGRIEKNDVCMPYSGVSKFHAYIQSKGNRWYISDCDSTNGTYIDKTALEPKELCELQSGAQLSFSKGCNLTFALSTTMYDYLEAFSNMKSRD